MKYVFVLEDDTKFQNEIVTALSAIDPKLQIRLFFNFAEFAGWIKLAAQSGPLALAAAGKNPFLSEGETPTVTAQADDELVLIVSKDEFLGSRLMNLVHKTRKWLINKKICSATDPTALVLTCFDSPDFNITLVEDSIVNNVIFKPFDKLLLIQHLNVALAGRHKPPESKIHQMKISARIEVIKEVNLEKISEVSMITNSTRPIEIGSVAKYYSELFISGPQRSIKGICMSCNPHPLNPAVFQCEFRFVGTSRNQLTKFRLDIQKAEHKEIKIMQDHKPLDPQAAKTNFVLIQSSEEDIKNLDHNISTSFQNVQMTHYLSIGQFMFALDPQKNAKKPTDKSEAPEIPVLPTQAEALIFDVSVLDPQALFDPKIFESTITQIKESVAAKLGEKTKIIFTSTRPLHDQIERILAIQVKADIFYRPVDQNNFSRRMNLLFPHLHVNEKLELSLIENKQVIKAANPVEITTVSEAGIVMKYYRPISPGTFRKFILWTPHEVGNPEFLASCNFAEEKPAEDGSYALDFVFFGLTDADVKYIRLWIMENYVQSKQAA